MVSLRYTIDIFIYSWRAADERPAIRITANPIALLRGCCTWKKNRGADVKIMARKDLWHSINTEKVCGYKDGNRGWCPCLTCLSDGSYALVLEACIQLQIDTALIIRMETDDDWYVEGIIDDRNETLYYEERNVICPDSQLPVGLQRWFATDRSWIV